jgi:hypothetical protein
MAKKKRSKPTEEMTAAPVPAQEENAFGIPFSAVSVQERIALLAYTYWEKRGRIGGTPEEDWFRAEQEILSQVNQAGQ